MDNYIILILGIFCGAGLLTLMSIIILRSHYRKVIKEKERGIVHHIHAQDQLKKELEYINVEKKVMERMLETQFDAVAFFTAKTERHESAKARRREGTKARREKAESRKQNGETSKPRTPEIRKQKAESVSQVSPPSGGRKGG